MFRQDRTNPSTAVSNWRGRRDTAKGHPSTAVSKWLNGGLFGTIPGAPGTLSLSAGSTPATEINLSWSAPADDGGVAISGYRIKKDGSVLVADTGSTGTTYTATGLTRATSYNFTVAAINAKGTGADGNTPSLTTSAEVPGAPGTLTLSNGSTPSTQIDLSWSAPSDTGGGTISGYRIKKDGSTLVADTSSTGTTYTATGLTAGTSYNFNVAAINEAGTGADGNTPSHTTLFSYSTTGSPTERTYSGYRSLHWTGSGTFVVAGAAATIDVLVVSGGGGGGYGSTGAGGDGGAGGGGAGGMKSWTSQTAGVGTSTITIGGGGAGGVNADDGIGTQGTTSSFALGGGSTLSTTGGGYGGGRAETGGAGGSGGGGGGFAAQAGGAATTGEGSAGGAGSSGTTDVGGGGGGGKAGAGGAGSGTDGGAGGTNGTNVYADGTTSGVGVGQFAGGGGGGQQGDESPAHGTGGAGGGGGGAHGGETQSAATANTGGGGGGGRQNQNGTAGGSGVVIIRWAE